MRSTSCWGALRILVALWALLSISPVVEAGVPSSVSYQGVLTDAGGQVVSPGSYVLRFAVYGLPSGGGTPLFVSDEIAADIEDGVYNVLIDDNPQGDLMTALDGGPAYIEVTVMSEMPPRVLPLTQRIASAPFAFFAKRAEIAHALDTPVSGPPYGIPTGLVMLWLESEDCPPGFEVASELGGRLPVGVDSSGTSPEIPDGVGLPGGDDEHSHAGLTGVSNADEDCDVISGEEVDRAHPDHHHSFTTDEVSHLPPTTTVLFCRRL